MSLAEESAWPGSRRSRLLAWALAGVALVGFIRLGVRQVVDQGTAALGAFLLGALLLILVFCALGTLLALRRPANPIGWLFTIGGLTWLASETALVYAGRALAAGDVGALTRLAAAVDDNIWPLGILCSVGLPLLLFPSGHPRSQRWQRVLVVMVSACVVTLVVSAFSPGPIANPVDEAATVANPLGLPQFATLFGAVRGVSITVLMATTVAAVVGVLVRFRSAQGVERQQLRWVCAGAVLAICGNVTGSFHLTAWLRDLLIEVGIGSLPLSVAIAILRYRLYDLDRIISRTLSYAVVTGLLVAAYVGSVATVSRLIPSGSSLAVAASTLAVAAAFQPLRRRVQAAVDRQFNRSRYDAGRTVEAFSRSLREQVDLDVVRSDLLDVVHATLQPSQAALWLRRPETASR